MASTVTNKLVVQAGPVIGQEYSLDQPQTIIGREPGVDFCIDAPGVSRRHARLTLSGGTCSLEDLGSSNGTSVNGQRLAGPHILQAGDEICLGQAVRLLYQAVSAENPAATMLEGHGANTLLENTPPPIETSSRGWVSASPGKTMIGEEPLPDLRTSPPQLSITIAGEAPKVYPLTAQRLTIGRADDNQIIIPSMVVSRHHATLERTTGGYTLVVLPEASNPVHLEGRPLTSPRILSHGDTLRIGGQDPGMMVTLGYFEPARPRIEKPRSISFGEKTVIQIGRDPKSDVHLDSPAVSQFHAQIERIGQRFRLTDLRSTNGTFVNDQRVDREVWLQANDTIRIGRFRFVVGQDQLSQFDETHGMRVEAIGLNKLVKKNLNILQNISMCIQPREFVVVVGQSGGGKSTLVDAIAGYRPATHGQVLVNNVDVYRHFDAIRNDIGYVPQKDIIHTELTIYQALSYAAQLRMPRDTTKAERDQRIMQVLTDLDLVHRKDNPISKLSGGQIKRVSIGVELLTQPGLFFLDEPTSGLDPGTETAFMHLMRRLSDQGHTIILVTHATKNVMLADKVVFLARGGYLAWFGPPEEALQYFDRYRSESDRRSRPMEFDQIYSILDNPQNGKAEEWAARYQQHPAYRKYILDNLQNRQGGSIPFSPPAAPATSPQPRTAAPKPRKKGRVSALRQFFILSARNLKIMTQDRSGLIMMLLTAPLVACLDFVIAPLMGRAPFDYLSGNASNASITLFLLSIYCLLVAGMSQMREFVKETDIYKRERLVNLKILPYVMSKVWIALLLAFYHAAAYTIVHFLAYDMPGGRLEFLLFYITLVFAAMAGMMNGLLASALAPTGSSAPLIMILFLIPQIVLSGALAPVPTNISQVASTRWTFESFVGITGIGADVADDTCWQLSKPLREAMTLEDKAYQGCRCMGVAVFTPGSCNFPGIGEYYKAEIDQASPVEPVGLPDKPAEPAIPPAPEPPEDQTDQVKMVQYLNSLQTYQDEVTRIQDGYRSQMSIYENEARVYQAEMVDYQTEKLEYETARNSAVQRAEGMIDTIRDKFGWAWVNKHDDQIFWAWLFRTWIAQVIIIAVYLIGIVILIKRKDV